MSNQHPQTAQNSAVRSSRFKLQEKIINLINVINHGLICFSTDAEEVCSESSENNDNASDHAPQQPSTSRGRGRGRPQGSRDKITQAMLASQLRRMVKHDPNGQILTSVLAEKVARELYKVDFRRMNSRQIGSLSSKINRALKTAFSYHKQACITRRISNSVSGKTYYVGFSSL